MAVGFRWKSATKLDDAAFDILKSVWTSLKEKLGSKAPPPPDELKEAPKPQAGPPPEAAKAPRPDWLTGVQYRLAYLAYYKGPIHGVNDRPTREAVIAFQTDQQIMIDGIPGPQTQGELVRVCGF